MRTWSPTPPSLACARGVCEFSMLVTHDHKLGGSHHHLVIVPQFLWVGSAGRALLQGLIRL